MIHTIAKGSLSAAGPRARCQCDECGVAVDVVCDYERRPSGVWEPNSGQIANKLGAKGWRVTRGRHVCPNCIPARATIHPAPIPKPAKEKTPMATDTAPQEPTREQRREIMQMLMEVYDTAAGRYRGVETDDSVADTLSVRPGWVAKMREEFFGPDGGNENLDQIEKKLGQALALVEVGLIEAKAVISNLEAEARNLRTLSDEVARIKKAVGPRIQRLAGVKA